MPAPLTSGEWVESPRLLSKEILGKRFGKWTVVEHHGTRRFASGEYRTYFKCRCECGKEAIVSRGTLTNKQSKRCLSCNTKESGYLGGKSSAAKRNMKEVGSLGGKKAAANRKARQLQENAS